MTVREAAERLECSEETVYALIATRQLGWRPFGAGTVRPRKRIDEHHLQAYLAASDRPAQGSGQATRATAPPQPARPVKLKHLRLKA